MIKSKKVILFGVIFLLVLGVFAGCVEKEPIEENQEQVELQLTNDLRSYFPMIPGMVYTYVGEGMEYASFTREIKYVQKPRVQFHDNNGGTVTARVYQVESDQITLRYKESEFYEDVNVLSKNDLSEVILKTPLKVNQSWQSGDQRREIVSIDKVVTVPIGTFYNVIQIKISSSGEANTSINYEYYAPNVGLILSEFESGDLKVTSSLESYGMKVASSVTPELPEKTKVQSVNPNLELTNPDLVLLAYQLDHQLRSLYQAAYESYINLNRLTEYSSTNFEQIVTVFQEDLHDIAVKKVIDQQVKLLRDFYQAGEGEVTFPSYEVIEDANLLQKSNDTARVGLSITRYFPAREWSGKAYNTTFNYEIELINEGGVWKLQDVVSD